MKAPKFWTRLGERFRNRWSDVLNRSTKADGDGELPDVGRGGVLHDAVRHPDDMGPVAEARTGGTLSRWTRRDQTLRQLQEGYERVNGLVEDIQKHLASQDARGERLCESLERLAESVHQLPETSRQQADTLEAIGSKLEVTNNRTAQLGEIVQEIPKLTRVQSEALGSIARQLEMAQEQRVVANQTMEKLGNAIQTLNDSNSAQVKALWMMNSTAGEQNDLLTKLIAKQSRLFIILITISAIMAAAVVTGAVLLFVRLGLS